MDFLRQVIEEGKKFIFEDKKDEWERYCKDHWTTMFEKMVLEDATEVMVYLSTTKLSSFEIMELVDELNHSEVTWNMVEEVVEYFHPLGEKFVKDINGNSLAKNRRELIEKVNNYKR